MYCISPEYYQNKALTQGPESGQFAVCVGIPDPRSEEGEDPPTPNTIEASVESQLFFLSEVHDVL